MDWIRKYLLSLTIVNIETLISFSIVNEFLNKTLLSRIRCGVLVVWILLIIPAFVVLGQQLANTPTLSGSFPNFSNKLSIFGPCIFLIYDNAQSVYLIYALKKLKNVKQGFREIVFIFIIQILLDWASFICAYLGLKLEKNSQIYLTNQVYVAISGGFHTLLSIIAFYHLRIIALTKSKILTAKKTPTARNPANISFQATTPKPRPSATQFPIAAIAESILEPS